MKIPATRRFRPAAGFLGLLLLVVIGGVTPGISGLQVDPGPQRPPARVLQRFQVVVRPAPTGTASPTPSPTPVPEPTPTATPSPTPPPTPQRPEPPPVPSPAPQPRGHADPAAAAAVYALTNELRASSGLPPLAANSALNRSAGGYAAVLAENDWFSHEGPDGSTMGSRAEAAGYGGWKYLSENLYRGFYGDTAEAIVQAWADSPGHYANMMGAQITEIGVGCYISGDLRWCVQDFGDR